MTFSLQTLSLPTASLTEYGLTLVAIGTPVPDAPTSLVAANGAGDDIDLTWTAPASGEPVTGYNVYRALSGSGSYTNIGSTTAPTVAYTDSSTANGVEYDYYVVSTNSGGESGASNVETITAGAGVGQVTGLAVSLVNDTGVLTWDAVSGADGYKVERTLTGAGSWSEIDDVATNTATDTYTAVDTGYDYRVRAYIGATYGAYSSTLSGVYSPVLYDLCDGTAGAAVSSGRSPTLGSGTWTISSTGTKDVQYDAADGIGFRQSVAGTGVGIGLYNVGKIAYTFKVDLVVSSYIEAPVLHLDASNYFMCGFSTTAATIRVRLAGTATTKATVSKAFTAGTAYPCTITVENLSATQARITFVVNGETLSYTTNTGVPGEVALVNQTVLGYRPASTAADEKFEYPTVWRPQ